MLFTGLTYKRKGRHAMILTEAEKVLVEIAKGGEYETEYDGRTYIFCRYCDSNMEKEGCKDDCLCQKSRLILGEKWVEILREESGISLAQEEEKKRVLQIERDRLREQALKSIKKECGRCGKLVSTQGELQHQTSDSCAKKFQKLSDKAKLGAK